MWDSLIAKGFELVSMRKQGQRFSEKWKQITKQNETKFIEIMNDNHFFSTYEIQGERQINPR